MTGKANFAINGRFLTQPVTGVQRYAHNVMRAMNPILSDAKEKVTVLAPFGANDPLLPSFILRCSGNIRGHAWEQFVLPTMWQGPLLSLCNTSAVLSREQVICIHDANVFESPDSYSFKFRIMYKILQPMLVRKAIKVATVSNASAAQLARHLPVPLAEIAVLSNGYEHTLEWDASKATVGPNIVDSIKFNNRKGFVFALGSRARHKNIGLLLGIANKLDSMEIDIIIAGGGANIYSLEKSDTISNVHFLNNITDNEISYLMKEAICLVFPSFTEGFGLPILEAMAQGCAVISSDRASMPEVCGNAALMASPTDPNTWVKHIQALTDSTDLRYDLIGKGREQSQKYSWNSTARGYLDIMQSANLGLVQRVKKNPSLQSNVAVIVATIGRPDIVTQTLCHLIDNQTLKPTEIIVSCVNDEDVGDLLNDNRFKIIKGAPGLPTQRNTALRSISSGIDIVVFFDDDFVSDSNWLKIAVETFDEQVDIVCFTGNVLVDGIKGPGLAFEEAKVIINNDREVGHDNLVENFSPYGCNMAFRKSAIEGLCFDENLVLYGWLEDRDFGSSLSKRGGRLVKSKNARGVHLGVKRGRVAGERLGYSQVVNPTYMLFKKTISIRQFASHLFRNVSSNLFGSLRPEPFIDRRGRLKGNIRGFYDILRMRVDPQRAKNIINGS